MFDLSRVLVVDDDPMNLSIIEEILGGSYVLSVARNGVEAMQQLEQFRPDLILLDIMMPEMDGYEVCENIRANETFQFVKIILVSGKSSIDERLKGYAVGADDYITKPFVDEELEAKVRIFLKLKHTEEIDAIKTDILNLFSHETRTPLNGIIGIGNMLIEDTTISQEIRDNVSLMVGCGYQLLDFSEKTKLLCILKSDIELDITGKCIAHEVDKVWYSLLAPASEKSIVLKKEIEQSLQLSADWSYLERALTFLLANAIKFSNCGGEITVSAIQSEDGVNIRVGDLGRGVVDTEKGIIFNEFSVSDIMHHKKGQGLSLAIVKQIMRAHKGIVSIEDNTPVGALFTLFFPYHSC